MYKQLITSAAVGVLNRPNNSKQQRTKDLSPSEASAAEDVRLIAAILADNDKEDAYRRLVEKYWKVLVGWVQPRLNNRRDAEEVVQEVFIKAFRSLRKLDAPRSFLAWILRIAGNQTTDFLRSRRATVSLDSLVDEGKIPQITEAKDITLDVERKEQLTQVLEAVSRLPEKYRLVVIMRYQLELSAKEIACRSGEPEGTIRNRAFRALEKVRKMLAKEKKESVKND